MGSIVALDPGFGNTKVCLDGEVSVIQSIVVRPKQLGKAGLGIKAANPVVDVAFDVDHFFVGLGATAWGRAQGNFDYSALVSPERLALFYAALAPLLTPGRNVINLLVIGLPVPLLQDERQAELFLAELKKLKGEHVFQVGKAAFVIQVDRLKVMPQPLGAYADWLLDDRLHLRKDASQAEVAVLDIGMNTVDLYAVQGGRVEPRYIAGEKVGVRRLLERMDGGERDLEELDSDLRQGRLSLPPDALRGWLTELMAGLERTMPRLSRFTAVIPTGGGALLIGDLLRLHLASRGAAVNWPSDPIGCNARGLWKWSAYGAHR